MAWVIGSKDHKQFSLLAMYFLKFHLWEFDVK